MGISAAIGGTMLKTSDTIFSALMRLPFLLVVQLLQLDSAALLALEVVFQKD
jgi:hypothetical protein